MGKWVLISNMGITPCASREKIGLTGLAPKFFDTGHHTIRLGIWISDPIPNNQIKIRRTP
jgi:hypothetical protein